MKYTIRKAAIVAALLFCESARAQTPTDVPDKHWARSAVLAVTGRGVMPAPGGKFGGDQKVTRRELTLILAGYARALEQRKWPKGGVSPARTERIKAGWDIGDVTRYELAAVLDKVARNVMQGLPKPTGKTYGQTEALPPAPKLTGIAKNDPAYAALAYLAKNRMVWDRSVLLKPGTQPVTGAQVADSLSMLIAGLNTRYTDEPQNREELGPPPGKKR